MRTLRFIKSNQTTSYLLSNGKKRSVKDHIYFPFNRKGYQPKTIIVNTEIPMEVISRPNNFPHFLMAVKLFKSNQDSSSLYSGYQIPQITYSPQQDCFAKVPSMFDIEFVEKDNSNPNQTIQTQENKTKMQAYQIF